MLTYLQNSLCHSSKNNFTTIEYNDEQAQKITKYYRSIKYIVASQSVVFLCSKQNNNQETSPDKLLIFNIKKKNLSNYHCNKVIDGIPITLNNINSKFAITVSKSNEYLAIINCLGFLKIFYLSNPLLNLTAEELNISFYSYICKINFKQDHINQNKISFSADNKYLAILSDDFFTLLFADNCYAWHACLQLDRIEKVVSKNKLQGYFGGGDFYLNDNKLVISLVKKYINPQLDNASYIIMHRLNSLASANVKYKITTFTYFLHDSSKTLPELKKVTDLPITEFSYNIKMSPDGNYLLVSYYNHIAIFNNSSENIWKINQPYLLLDTFTKFYFTAKVKFNIQANKLVVYTTSNFLIYSLNKEKIWEFIDSEIPPDCIDISKLAITATGNYFAVCNLAGSIYIFEEASASNRFNCFKTRSLTKKYICKQKLHNTNADYITSLAFSKDQKNIIIVGSYNTVVYRVS